MSKPSLLTIRWITLIVILLILGGIYLVFTHFYVYTSDAYVDGQAISIAPEVSGKVIRVNIKEGMHVKKGQILFEIDPHSYHYQLEQDLAALQAAKNTKAQLLATIASSKAAELAAAVNVQHTRATWQHMSGKARAAFSEQAVKNARFEYDTAVMQLVKAKHDLATQITQLGPRNKPFPAIAQAVTSIKTDLYNLSKTTVRAPANGIITNEFLLPGAIVAPGTPLFAIVEPNHFWITGRYKEGALDDIKVGDKVGVYLKMYGWHRFTGTVADIGYGVNRRQASNTVVNSSLPYLEQTEDWIQLQQRFPVTIKLDKAPNNMPYRIGASARIFIHR